MGFRLVPFRSESNSAPPRARASGRLSRLSRALAPVLLFLSFACGKKPVVTVGAVAACGPMPPKLALCIETLPVDSTDAELARCMVNTVETLIAENQALRIKYSPCAK
jgi:hypothetical protein